MHPRNHAFAKKMRALTFSVSALCNRGKRYRYAMICNEGSALKLRLGTYPRTSFRVKECIGSMII